MVRSKNNLGTNSIKEILTLRYNPSTTSQIHKKTWKDFVEKSVGENVFEYVESLITANIAKSIKNSKKTRATIALSSGVDSTLVLSLLKKTCPDVKINAISIKFANSVDESKHAAKIAREFDIQHQTVYIENFLKELPAALQIVKQPFWDLHWYHVVKKAKNFGNVLVSGDGGDELFGGYTFRYERFLALTKKTTSPLAKVKAYLKCHERDWVPDQHDVFGKKLKFSWDTIYSRLLPYFDNKLDPLSQVFLADFNGKLLYNWIPLNKKIHDSLGVKQVTPILSKQTIEYALHLPTNLKYDPKTNTGKLILRKIIDKYDLQRLLIKKKQGFSVDTMNLWKSHGYDLCKYYLADSRTVKQGWISDSWIQKHLQKNLDARYVNKFLGIFALEIWYRLFITREIKPTHSLTV